jgi:hypothetical protein
MNKNKYSHALNILTKGLSDPKHLATKGFVKSCVIKVKTKDGRTSYVYVGDYTNDYAIKHGLKDFKPEDIDTITIEVNPYFKGDDIDIQFELIKTKIEAVFIERTTKYDSIKIEFIKQD